MMAYLDLIPTDELNTVWGVAEPWVLAAVEASPASEPMDKLEAMCLEGSADLWLIRDAAGVVGAIITEVVETTKGLTCHFLAASGSFTDDGDMSLGTIERWARGKGCVRLELTGRLGWLRRLERRGWREAATIHQKDI